MPRVLDLDTFERAHPQAPRVVGIIDEAVFAPTDMASLGRYFKKVIASAGIADDHATGIVRRDGGAEFHLRCSTPSDVDRLVAQLTERGVALCGRPPYWQFVVDAEVFDRLIKSRRS